MFEIIYPNRRSVSEEWIRGRYADEEATEFMSREKIKADEPADQQRVDRVWNDAYNEEFSFIKAELEDRGLVTFSR
jgi:hypothetical protein